MPRIPLACAALAAALAVAPSARALTFTASLAGANERPTPVASNGSGTGSVELNGAETQISVVLSWTGLTSNTTLAHIHGPGGPNDVALPVIDLSGFIALPKTTSGELNGGVPVVFDVTAQQVADLKNGLWYFNVHSVNFGAGEIRGQIVPEPAASLLLGAGLGGLVWKGRRSRVS